MEEVADAGLLTFQRRAAAAAQILEHQLFREAVAAIKSRIDCAFVSAKPEDDRPRLALQMKMLALNEVLAELRRHVETGKLAEKRAEQLKRQRVA